MKQSKFVLALLFAKVEAHHEFQHEDIKRFVGCFMDDSKRDFKALSWDTSPKKCVEMAEAKGLKYFSLQWGKECFGGNDYPDREKRPDKECSKKCKHDSKVTCGNGWRNSVYELFPDDAVEKCSGHQCNEYRGNQNVTNSGRTC